MYLIRRGELDFVKVVDFGVSKAVHEREEGPEWQRLTRTGMVLGTPLYMSPEQARGHEDVDARADVWAVGVMLYECLTGEVPFRANNYLGVISQVLTQEALPPSRLRPELGIPVAVETVVMRALEKDRDKRYQTMAQLERDLERLLAGDHNVGLPEVVDPAATSRDRLAAQRRRAPRWHLGVAAVVVIAVGMAVALARNDQPSAVWAPPPPVRNPVKPAAPPVAPPSPAPAAKTETASERPQRTERRSRQTIPVVAPAAEARPASAGTARPRRSDDLLIDPIKVYGSPRPK